MEMRRELDIFGYLNLGKSQRRIIRLFSRLVQQVSAADNHKCLRPKQDHISSNYTASWCTFPVRLHSVRLMMKIVLLIVSLAISEIIATRPRRSIGGSPISIEEAAYFVSITHSESHICSGVLITMRHVLSTAYHLKPIEKYITEAKVLTSTDQRMTGENYHAIKKIRIHPDFKEGSFTTDRQNDISVITLRRPIVKSDGLPDTIKLSTKDLGIGAWAELIAFNTSSFNKGDPLHKLEVKLEWRGACQRYCYNPESVAGILCAQHDAVDGMSDNDSGSPLIVDGKLVGIASVVVGFGGHGDIFTSVYAHADFIKKETKCADGSCVIA